MGRVVQGTIQPRLVLQTFEFDSTTATSKSGQGNTTSVISALQRIGRELRGDVTTLSEIKCDQW
jgi:hypothetical protein